MTKVFFRATCVAGGFLICLPLFLLTVNSAVAVATKKPVKVGIYDIEPLCETDGIKGNRGLFVDILKHIAQEEKWHVHFIKGSLELCRLNLVQGKIDLLLAADYSQANEAVCDFTRETVISTWGQVYSPKNAAIGSILDLSGHTMGVVRDEPYNHGLRELLKRFNISCKYVEFKHSEDVLNAIEKGWIDIGIVDRLYGVQHQGEYAVSKTPVVLAPVELRFAAPKGKNKELLEAIDYHMKGLKDDPHSIYYQMLDGIFGMSGKSGVSKWFVWGTGIAALMALLAGGTSLFFKQQVRAKTSQLSIKNEALSKEVRMRQKAREALLESEARYRSLVENTLDGYFVFEYPSGEIRFLNQRIRELLGYTSEEAYQKVLWDFMTEKDRKRFIRRFRNQGEDGSYERVPFTCTAVRKDGSTFLAETSTSMVNEQVGTVIQGSLRDISERERLKRHLQHAEKMEAVGTLAGGIAHDFNNLLMGILGNVSLVSMELDPDDPQQEMLQLIEDYVMSGSQLTKQLLGFARGGKYEAKELDLSDVVEKTSHMFGRTKKEIRIHTSYEQTKCKVKADQGQIEQVLLNMYVNAWQAMPGGGDLYLKTETVTVDEGHVRAHQGKLGRFLKISITDTGVGMDEKTQKRIFEPFFTTKEMGRGTGLGLASAYGIIKNHGGFIDVYSTPGKGATFNIYLPIVKAKPTLFEERQKNGMKIIKGEGTVLMVDDEEMVIDVGSRFLERIGYRVLVARSGEEAVKIYGENKSSIDLVLLDMIMPGMGGGKTFDGLKRIDPSVKVILASGYSMNTQTTEILNRGCRGFIQKPFSMAQLSRKLNEVARAA